MRGEYLFFHLVKPDSGYPKTAPKGMKNGAKGAKMVLPLAIKAVTVLLLLSAIVKLVGTRFQTIRGRLGMTQEQFTSFGFSLSAIRH